MSDLRKILADATPGPWGFSFESVDPEWAIVTTRGGSVISNVNGDHRQDANARLIALAPTLAAALLKAEESLKVALNDLDEWVACKDSLEKAGFNMDDTADRAEIVRTALSEIASITGGGNDRCTARSPEMAI